MTVKLIGAYPTVPRVKSGLFSLDYALGHGSNLGIPMRTILELYGYTNVGKSTLSYYLAGKVTGKGNVAICDLEMADTSYIQHTMEVSGLDGEVRIMDLTDEKQRFIPHETMLGNLALELVDEGTGACILDSVGAITPIAEADGDFGEAFMGRRAKLVAQVSRNFTNSLRNKNRPSLAIVINHVHSIMGGRGHNTAGGDTLKYLAASRVMIWPKETFTESEESNSPIGFLVSGKTEKLRYGGRGKEFQYYIVPGYGVHAGASALFDCVELGLAERGTTVKMDGKSLGYLKKDLLKYAEQGKNRKFEPFQEALIKYEEGLRDYVAEIEEDDSDKATEEPKKKKK